MVSVAFHQMTKNSQNHVTALNLSTTTRADKLLIC